MLRRRQLVDTVIHGMSLAGLPSLLRHFRPDEFCILMLHGLTDRRHHDGIGNTEGIHIHVDEFERICQLLASHYRVLPLEEVITHIETGKPCPGGGVVLTFDDGYRSNFELAFPILKKYGLHATIFVATDFVENGSWQWWDRIEYAMGHTKAPALELRDGALVFSSPLRTEPEKVAAFRALLPSIKRLPQEEVSKSVLRIEEALGVGLDSALHPPGIYRSASWDEIVEMQRSGHVTIGGHTHTHRILGRCREETARRELLTCHNLLTERVGIRRPLFSYPNGHAGDHSDLTKSLLRELGFRCALTTEHGFNTIHDDPFTLRRFSTGNDPRYVDVTASGTLKMLLALRTAFRPTREAA